VFITVIVLLVIFPLLSKYPLIQAKVPIAFATNSVHLFLFEEIHYGFSFVGFQKLVCFPVIYSNNLLPLNNLLKCHFQSVLLIEAIY
jgi:hypothetical protein